MLEAEAPVAAETSTADLYPRDFWYAGLAAQRLTDQPIGLRLLDQDLVFFRDADGAAHVLHDRCAHRGVQLSLGVVTDGALACRYHGWRYGGNGLCVHIPSLVAGQDIAKGVGVRAFPCVEMDAYIWVWMGEGPPSPARPPGVPEYSLFKWAQGSVEIKCSALALIENNLDVCHPVFAHPYTHGQFFVNQALGFLDQPAEMRRTDVGMVVVLPPTAGPDEPVSLDAATVLDFKLPDRVIVSFPTGPQGPLRVVLHMVPTGPGSCRQEWLVSGGPAEPEGPAKPPNAPMLSDKVPLILQQDADLLESAQRMIDQEGHGFERSVEADASTLLARRIYALACKGQWASGRDRLPARRIFSVRT